MVRAVAFDFAGTLFTCREWEDVDIRHLGSRVLAFFVERDIMNSDDELAVRADEAYQAVREQCRRDLTELDAVSSAERVLAELGLAGIPRSAIHDAVHEVSRRCLDDAQLRAGARDLLLRLRARGMPLALISNAACWEFVDWALERDGITDLFDAVLVSGRIDIRKPDRAIFFAAADRIGVPPEQVAFVGDSHRFDVVGAVRAGMKAIWLAEASQPIPQPHPAAVIERLDELEQALGIDER